MFYALAPAVHPKPLVVDCRDPVENDGMVVSVNVVYLDTISL